MKVPFSALLVLTLSACNGDAQNASSATAQGEVLPGSVSDAMIPLDQVKSQAPLAPKVESADKKAAMGTAKAKAAADAPGAASPAEEPAEAAQAAAE